MDYRSIDDVSLMYRVASGEQAALGALYDRYAGLLLSIGRRIVGFGKEAEDLVHDVFLEAWRHAGDYDPGRGSVRAWLVLRMRSRALDRRRSVRLSRSVVLDDEEREAHMMSPDDPSVAADREAVRMAVDALPPKQREVLLLGYFKGLSAAEIALAVDAPVGTIKSRVAAARTKLRAWLAAERGGA